MKIGFYELEDWEKEYFQKEFQGQHEMMFFDNPLKIDIPDIDKFDAIVIFIHSQMTKEVLDKMPNLKFISTMSTGFDHIDLEECKRRNIVVSMVPSYGETVVAEQTFALLLAISRRLIESVQKVKSGVFLPDGLTGFELRGKTLGVIGTGSIGTNVIKIAKGFGMNVVAYKRTPDYVMEKELGFKFVDMNTLYASSDVITLHIPYNEHTHHYLNAQAFSQMKDGVIILNTARGALIDTTELLKALDAGKVKAAGLDVLEEEPILEEERELLSKNIDSQKLVSVVEDHMLVNNPHVVLTPHNAFNSVEALRKITETTHENLSAFFAGAPINTPS